MSDSTPPQSLAARPAILLVDDEPHLAQLAHLALSGRFDVRSTTSPHEALALGADPSVRLLLTDFVMDDMNGIELIRRLHETRPDLPCILFSGNLTRATWTSAINSGSRYVFAKPLPLAAIIKVCTEILNPPLPPPLADAHRDFVESIPWSGALGKNLRELSGHLLAGRSPICIQSADDPFPFDLLHLLLPDLQSYPQPDSPPPARALLTDLRTLNLNEQDRIAQLLPARCEIPWLLLADAGLEELLEQGRLAQSLYLSLGAAVVQIPPPLACPADSLHLCHWWLCAQSPPATLTDEATTWLSTQLPYWNWSSLTALLREACAIHPDQPIQAHSLKQAALSLFLGPELADIPRYADYAAEQIHPLRTAWDALT